MRFQRKLRGILPVFIILIFIYWWLKVEDDITKKLAPRPSKLILYYTTIFGSPYWHGIQGERLNTYLKEIGCKYHCFMTYNKSKLEVADVVIFHARDIEWGFNKEYSAPALEVARERAPQNQKWIFLSHENPQYKPLIYVPYKQIFNGTATFSRNSDIFMPYGKYRPVPEVKGPLKNYAAEKKHIIAWAVSNCGIMREKYALELQEYIPLTVYGRCRQKFHRQRSCKHFTPECDKELSTYKFYLAFENDFCEDYVTEKYWERIVHDTVPVVMGANYDGLAIPGSYIDTSKFTSIKALADYLNYLDANDTAYNEYFAWKLNYSKDSSAKAELHCQICTEINSEKFNKQNIMTLSEVFNYKKTCSNSFQSKFEKYKQQIEASKKNRQ
eukprot:gene12256-13519_t